MGNDHAEIAREIFSRGWGEGDFSGLEEALAGPFMFHIRGTSQEMYLDGLRAIVARWRVGFPDLRFEIDDLVADGELVAVRTRLTGTNLGMWRERPPTGRRIEVEHMFFLRFRDRRLTEVFELLDQEALSSQLEP
ncbi:MAG TPA: ester cyclase [Acidimicrobiia bacterium]|nr:ester cyclase [Acidimicrobiia bacterium]